MKTIPAVNLSPSTACNYTAISQIRYDSHFLPILTHVHQPTCHPQNVCPSPDDSPVYAGYNYSQASTSVTPSQVFTLLLLVGAPLGCCEIAPKIWPKWLYLFYFFKSGLESYKDRNCDKLPLFKSCHATTHVDLQLNALSSFLSYWKDKI